MNAPTSLYRLIPLAAIVVSPIPAQMERRAHFDQTALAELAESIKVAGVIQPILVRPVREPGYGFELIAGERRYLASQMAGLREIPAMVRHLSDREVAELQLVENLQRQDLHELHEAAGYEQLLKHGYTVADIALKLGKSESAIYKRLQLNRLVPEAREVYLQNRLPARTMFEIARIPHPEHQSQALKDILTDRGFAEEGEECDPMPYQEARSHIRRRYMTWLEHAEFPLDDLTLNAERGSCLACPHNTACKNPVEGNLHLFGDIEGAEDGVCMDSKCFQAKLEAWEDREDDRLDAAEDDHQEPSTDPDDQAETDDDGEDAGTNTEMADRDARRAQAQREREEQDSALEEEREFRKAVFAKVHDKPREKLEHEDLVNLAMAVYQGLEAQEHVDEVWGWDDIADLNYAQRDAALQERLIALDLEKLNRFFADCLVANELKVWTNTMDRQPERLLAEAKRCGVNLRTVRTQMKKAAKKKADQAADAAA